MYKKQYHATIQKSIFLIQFTELKKYLFNAIIPEAPITISKELINGSNLLLLKVWNGSKPPYIYMITPFISGQIIKR